MGRSARVPEKRRSGEEGNDVTRAAVRGQALQSGDTLLTLHLLQLPRSRWELRDGNGIRSRRSRERRQRCSTRGRARPGPWSPARPSAGSRGAPSAPRRIAPGSVPLTSAAEFDTTPARGGRGEKLNPTTL